LKGQKRENQGCGSEGRCFREKEISNTTKDERREKGKRDILPTDSRKSAWTQGRNRLNMEKLQGEGKKKETGTQKKQVKTG